MTTQVCSVNPYRLSDGRIADATTGAYVQVAAQDHPSPAYRQRPTTTRGSGSDTATTPAPATRWQATIPPEYGIWWIDADIGPSRLTRWTELVRASEALGRAVVAPMVLHRGGAAISTTAGSMIIGTFCAS